MMVLLRIALSVKFMNYVFSDHGRLVSNRNHKKYKCAVGVGTKVFQHSSEQNGSHDTVIEIEHGNN